MRILVTGAAGFIGSHLCDRLLQENHQVVALDNIKTGRLSNIEHLAGRDDFLFIKHDVSNFIFVPGKVDAVLHFASPASPNPKSPYGFPQLPIQTIKVGSLGTHNALGVARAHQARFLLASTSEVYGDPQEHPQQEDYCGHVDPVGPRSVYDEAKRFAEAMTMAYHRYHHLDTRIVRIFNTYGPRMRVDDGRAVANFARQALLGEPLTIHGDGSQTRSFCYIDDLIEGIYRLLMADVHQPINLGNPRETSIYDLAQIVNRLTHNKAGTKFFSKERAPT
ncbi:MAG: GDP-mannose 4,6-dehydratase, partial [Ktedonobacteraceae bacterium]|nr:GDP-mannose 4,6-dehydratase [Ktedonobacteraceae bacterium]